MTNYIERAALWYAANDWKIFPVAAQSKVPLTENGYHDASSDKEAVLNWWALWPTANIAVACKQSGFIALDGDPSKYKDGSAEFIDGLLNEFPTTAQTTPTLGIHLIYKLPEGVDLSNSSGDLPAGIDVRVNGYILLTPSTVLYRGSEAEAKGVPDGHLGPYRWVPDHKPTDIKPAPLPGHVLQLLTTSHRKTKTTTKKESPPNRETEPEGTRRYAVKALEYELDTLARTPEGDRNNQLNISAFSLGQLVAAGALPEGEVVDKLTITAETIGLDPREIERTIRSGVEKGKEKPRAIPELPPDPPLLFKNGNGKSGETPDAEPDKPSDEDQAEAGAATKIYREIQKMGYGFRMNIMRDRIEHENGQALHDGELAMIVANLYDRGMKNRQLMQDVILAQAWQNRYDPLSNFLTDLEWNGTDWIELLAGWFLCKSDPIQYADGHYEKTFAVWLRRWLIGAVGKSLVGTQNPMLVLAGGQGIGKSEFARWLCSPLSDYFVSSPIMPDNVDHLRWLSGNFIWEVAELGATTRKADIEGLKAFLTRPECTYRVPYAKNEVHRPARASFIGTINLDNAGFLMDVTGNRRFLSVELGGIDWQKYTTNIDPVQIWAQAMHLYGQDESSWRLAKEEEAHRDVINESYGAEDPILDAIERLFDYTEEADPEEDANFIATNEIVNMVATQVHETTTRQLQMGIAKALRRLNVTKGRLGGTRGMRGYFGIKRKIGT